MNMTPNAAVHDMTPEEKFTGKKADVSHFKVFGCIAYVHVPDELRTKLDPKAKKCVFIGYSVEQKGYKCYNPIMVVLLIVNLLVVICSLLGVLLSHGSQQEATPSSIVEYRGRVQGCNSCSL
ncbi:hypothetical protein L7F22_058673 [Adiantum nelumboides]|nr:hypothetical protein [Adiantum nelumboides]